MGKRPMLAIYREAFNQYLSRYGVPLPSPSRDIRAGDLVVFRADGTCLKLTSIYDAKPNYAKETSQIDPIVSNGMRSRSLKPEEHSLFIQPEFKVLISDIHFQPIMSKIFPTFRAITSKCLILQLLFQLLLNRRLRNLTPRTGSILMSERLINFSTDLSTMIPSMV